MMSKITSVSTNSLLMLRGATVKAYMTNQHQSPVKVSIYDCICRRDNDDDNPETCFNIGIANQSGGFVGANEPGLTPYKSVYFNQFWKIGKVTTVTLDPGATHCHYVKAKVNKVIPNQLLQKSPGNYFKGLTSVPLVVHHGFPVNDASLLTNISLAATALDVTYTVIYDFTWDEHSNVSASHDYNFATITNEHGIEVMDGAVTTFTSA